MVRGCFSPGPQQQGPSYRRDLYSGTRHVTIPVPPDDSSPGSMANPSGGHGGMEWTFSRHAGRVQVTQGTVTVAQESGAGRQYMPSCYRLYSQQAGG